MSETYISVIASPEAIEALQTNASSPDISFSPSSPMNSSVDVLDAPLNPQDVQQLLEVVKVILETGTAGLTFVAAIMTVVKTYKETILILKNPVTGEELGRVDGKTSEDEVRKILRL